MTIIRLENDFCHVYLGQGARYRVQGLSFGCWVMNYGLWIMDYGLISDF